MTGYQVRTHFIALLAAPTLAWGQACPAGAEAGPHILNGTRVTLLEIAQDDSYANERWLIGKEGVATGLVNSEHSCWYGGEVRFDDGTSRYFYRVAVDAGSASGTWPTCDAGALVAPIPHGTQTLVLGVHPDDLMFGSPLLAPGTVVTTFGQMSAIEDCWMSGSLQTLDGTEHYLHRVSLGSDANLCPANAIRSTPQAGERLQVVRVHHDSLDTEQALFTVGLPVDAVGTMDIEDSCWLAGDLFIPSSNQTLPVSRIALAQGNGANTTCTTAASARVGDTVVVASVGLSDSYAVVVHRVVGTEGIVRRITSTSDGCWVAGEVVASNGVQYRFTQVSLVPVAASDDE
jgi:hypothetical protein